jgi:hypothetical protein
MKPKVIKLDGQVYGLDVEYESFDRINTIREQRAALAMNDLLHSQSFQELSKGMGMAMGHTAEAMEQMKKASDYTNNEDALRAMDTMRKQMTQNMDAALRDLEAGLEDDDEPISDFSGPKLSAAIGWFDCASEIQKQTALTLLEAQEAIVATTTAEVFKYVNANLRQINKSITQSGLTAPRLEKLKKESDALGIYGFDELFLNAIEPECRLVGSLGIHGSNEDYHFEILVSFKQKTPKIAFKMIENSPDSE